jgi:hypothetical protein
LSLWLSGGVFVIYPASSQKCLKPVPIEVELCHKAEKACLSQQLTLFFANSWIGEQIATSKKSVEQQAAGWRNAKKINPRQLGPLVALRQHTTYGCTFGNTTQSFGRTISEGTDWNL